MTIIDKLIEEVNHQNIQAFLRDRNDNIVRQTEPIDLTYLLKDEQKAQFETIVELGEYNYDDDATRLVVFSGRYKGELSSRSSKVKQKEIAIQVIDRKGADAALFVFYDAAGKFRFSFVQRQFSKREKFSNWKRFTYFVDKDSQTNKTFKDRVGKCNFASLNEIQEAFSVEPLSDDFFNTYKNIYVKFCGYLTGKHYVKNGGKWEEKDYPGMVEAGLVQLKNAFGGETPAGRKEARDYIKKLLGRLVFLKFLEKKGWLGVPSTNAEGDWTGGEHQLLSRSF